MFPHSVVNGTRNVTLVILAGSFLVGSFDAETLAQAQAQPMRAPQRVACDTVPPGDC